MNEYEEDIEQLQDKVNDLLWRMNAVCNFLSNTFPDIDTKTELYMKPETENKTDYEIAVDNIKDIIRIQCSPGNYNFNEYMWGIANGLILALSCCTGERPEYMEKPVKWLHDLPTGKYGGGVSCGEELEFSQKFPKYKDCHEQSERVDVIRKYHEVFGYKTYKDHLKDTCTENKETSTCSDDVSMECEHEYSIAWEMGTKPPTTDTRCTKCGKEWECEHESDGRLHPGNHSIPASYLCKKCGEFYR